jgi:hypothetical protein
VDTPQSRPSNADFTVAITYADGSSDKGKVVRVERSEDWYGDDGFGDGDLNLTLEGNGTEKQVPWTEIARVDITYGGLEEVDCSYDSAYDPAMYMCVLRTTSKAKTRDGKTWDVAVRHKWRFVLEGGGLAEFWVYKLPARRQEEPGAESGLNATEQETRLYDELQKELLAMKVAKVPKTITITVP